MQLLLVYATTGEALPLIGSGNQGKPGVNYQLKVGGKEVTLLYSGAGSVAMAYELGRLFLSRRFDLAINAGICGSFNRELVPGTVVNVEKDCFADLGAEDDNDLLSVFDIGLQDKNEFPFTDGVIKADRFPITAELQNVSAVTVNTATGSERTVERMMRKYSPDVESMEGAAFLYACKLNDIPCMQIRSVSNFVEKRNRESWKIGLALDQLAKTVERVIHSL